MLTKTHMIMLFALLSAISVQAAEPEPTLQSLQDEVKRLNSIVPGQAFAMTQVAYNFNNLWFAAQAKNWPLAQFYLNETKVRLRWAMRITPIRKTSAGEIELTPIATALETGPLAAAEQAITAQDNAGFVAGYTAMMHGCQGCHEALEKPFLQLQIPTVPAESMIRFTP
jgi:hypothetical protein